MASKKKTPGKKNRKARRTALPKSNRSMRTRKTRGVLLKRKGGARLMLPSEVGAALRAAEREGYMRGWNAAANNPDEARDSLRRGRI